MIVTPVFRGHVDRLQLGAGNNCVGGWLLREDVPFRSFDIAVNGVAWAEDAPVYPRHDVVEAYRPTLGSNANMLHSGFAVSATDPAIAPAPTAAIVEIVPQTEDGRRLDTWRSYFCDYQQELAAVPQPPKDLQERVGGSEGFIYAAAQLTTLVMTYVGKYRPMQQWRRVLDWGCGCARVSNQFRKLLSSASLFGCDIDAVAIEWNKKHIPGPVFARVEPYPPTQYPDAFFDVVYGVSVLTHLDEETQFRWLEELKRITAPGAVLMLSVIGETLRATNMPQEIAPEFYERGFAVQVPYYSDMVAEFSHQGYYKEAYHSRTYIESEWSKWFQLLEYVETKHQDLVLLQRN